MSIRLDTLERRLDEFISGVPGIEGGAVITYEGLVVARRFKPGIDEVAVAAMGAALLSVAQKVVKELNKGQFDNVVLTSSDGLIIVTSLTDDLLLLVMTSPDAKLGLVNYELKKLRDKIFT